MKRLDSEKSFKDTLVKKKKKLYIWINGTDDRI